MEACNFLRSLAKKIKKISEVLRRAILQNPCVKASVVESAFNKIAGTDSVSATWLRRGFHQGSFLTTISKFTSFTRVSFELCFLQNCRLFTGGPQLVQIWYNIDCFFKAHFYDSPAIPILSWKEFVVMFRVGLHI